jgi:hypothetical protein
MLGRWAASQIASAGRIVLVALDERLDIGWRNEPDSVPELGELAPPIMRSSAGFHSDEARRLGREKSQQPRPTDLLAEHDAAQSIRPMGLKYVLGDV